MARPSHDPLTDPQVRALRPKPIPQDIRDGETRGLILTVLPSGVKQFGLRYRYHGKQRRLVLGTYPALSIAKARKEARKQQSAIDANADPAGERKAAKAVKTDTVAALAADYMRDHARRFKRTADEDQRVLDVEVLPRWRDRSVRTITREDIKALLRSIVKRGSPIMANRILSVVRRMFNYALDEGWLDGNPASRIRPEPETSRDRVLSDHELRQLWRCLSNLPTTDQKPAPGRPRAKGEPDDPLCPISAALAALLKVRLLTAQRGGEVARMKWADLDLDAGWWTIPGADTKNGEPHRVPLVPEAVALIRAQQPDDVEKKKTDDRPAYVFLGRGDSSVQDRAKKAPAVLAHALAFDFRGHDLRRTAATRMAEAGVPRDHISRVLNHVEGGPRATQVYNRYQYDREKRIALEAWARTLTAIIESTPTAGSVVAITRGA